MSSAQSLRAPQAEPLNELPANVSGTFWFMS
jgi:hypothetical protein